jgi:hypothetical protein
MIYETNVWGCLVDDYLVVAICLTFRQRLCHIVVFEMVSRLASVYRELFDLLELGCVLIR